MDSATIQEADRLFERTKINLFFKKGSGFLGSILCKMTFHWVDTIRGEPLDTAATDGLNLYWNPDFFLSLDEETRITVLAHELWHVAYMHMLRLGDRNHEIHNIAADHVINLMLKEHKYFMGGFKYFMDPMFKDWATDDVYYFLMKNPPPSKGGSLGNDIIPVQEMDKGMDVIGAIVSAITTARMTNTAGDIPGEITMMIDKFLNPLLPWEVLLYNFFNEMTDMEYSFRRPNRRYTDPIMPGMTGISGLEHLIYYLDISGSISDDDILRFNSEVKFIWDEFKPRRLTLVTFDTEIQDVYEFEEGDDFEKIVVTGRGGTDLFEVFEHANKHQPSAMIIFTDLYVGIPEEQPLCPLIWVCIDNKQATVPYGKLIHMNRSSHSEGVTDPSLFEYGPDTGIHAGG